MTTEQSQDTPEHESEQPRERARDMVIQAGDETIIIVPDGEPETSLEAEPERSTPEEVEPEVREPGPDSSEVQELRRQMGERDSWYAQQLAQQHSRAEQAERRAYDAEIQKAEVAWKSFDHHETILVNGLKAARASGDTDHATDLEGQISQIRQQKTELGNLIGQAKANPPRPTQQAPQPPRAQVAPGVSAKNPLAETYARNNASWLQDPKREAERDYFLKIDNQLVRRGLNPQSKEYFAELNKEMAVFKDRLDLRDLDNQKTTGAIVQRQRGTQSRTPGTGVTSAAISSQPRKVNGQKMPAVQAGLLSAMGMNPNDSKVQEAWRKHHTSTNSGRR